MIWFGFVVRVEDILGVELPMQVGCGMDMKCAIFGGSDTDGNCEMGSCATGALIGTGMDGR